MIDKLDNFLNNQLWQIPTREKPAFMAFLIRQLRVLVLSIKNFLTDDCQLRASALTFYVLLSLVPFAALLFGIAKGFGLESLLENLIYQKMQGQEEVVSKVVEFAKAMLEHTKGGIIAGVGMIILFWTTIKLLSNVEAAFNHIWGVKKARSWVRKISDYLSLTLICPVLIVSSSFITVLITSKLNEAINYLISIWPLLAHFELIAFLVIKIIPYLVLWILFTFIYIFIPNTRVKFRPAFIAGIIAGSCFQVLQWIYINFQIYLGSYGAIYGSFSALPLFLLWLQASWLIILFGAQIAFAIQNVNLFEFDPICQKLSKQQKRIISLSIAKLAVQYFKAQEKLSAEKISEILNIPIRLVNHLLAELNQAGVLSEVTTPNEKQVVFQPARAIDDLDLIEVSQMLDQYGVNDCYFMNKQEVQQIEKSYQEILTDAKQSKHNLRLC